MNRRTILALAAAALILASAAPAGADMIWQWDGGNGLSATVVFDQAAPRELRVTALNTSTAMPDEIDGDTSNQFLTSISFDLGHDVNIIGGSAVLGEDARTVNFDDVDAQLGPGADVSGEWGFSNKGYKIDLARNVLTAMQSQSTKFGGPNLDGPSNLSGPQGGLLADPILEPIGGLGGIQGPVIFTVYTDHDFTLSESMIACGRIEFGSDAAYVGSPTPGPTPVPEPATMALLAVGGLALGAGAWRRKKLV